LAPWHLGAELACVPTACPQTSLIYSATLSIPDTN